MAGGAGGADHGRVASVAPTATRVLLFLREAEAGPKSTEAAAVPSARRQQTPATQHTMMMMSSVTSSFRFFLLSQYVVGAAVGASVVTTATLSSSILTFMKTFSLPMAAAEDSISASMIAVSWSFGARGRDKIVRLNLVVHNNTGLESAARRRHALYRHGLSVHAGDSRDGVLEHRLVRLRVLHRDPGERHAARVVARADGLPCNWPRRSSLRSRSSNIGATRPWQQPSSPARARVVREHEHRAARIGREPHILPETSRRPD